MNTAADLISFMGDNVSFEGSSIKVVEDSEKLPPKAYHTSKRQDYETPPELIAFIHKVMGYEIVVDVCATKETRKVLEYLGPDHENLELRDALVLPWHKACFFGANAWLWMNPPYKQIDKWVHKAVIELEMGARIIMLLPARTDRPWFHALCSLNPTIYFFRHRLTFEGEKNQAPFPSILVVMHPEEGVGKFGFISLKGQSYGEF